MIGWLWRMIVGRFDHCRHEWETMDKASISTTDEATKRIIGFHVNLRCKKCGIWHSRKL